MNDNGLSYIDLFAGAGGLSEGFIQSGYRPIAHVEMNEYAARTIETRNDFMRKIQEETKSDKCIMCGKAQTSFGNSHSVPKMVIKTIVEDGKLYHVNKLIERGKLYGRLHHQMNCLSLEKIRICKLLDF